MDDVASDDPASQYMHLDSVFFAIAIVVWTSVAVWLGYSAPSGDIEDTDTDAPSVDGTAGGLHSRDGVLGKVAQGFANLLLEGKDTKNSSGGHLDRSGLDLTKLEELLTPSKADLKREIAAPAGPALGKKSVLKTGSGALGTTCASGADAVKEASGGVSPRLSGLCLGKEAGTVSRSAAGDPEGGEEKSADLQAFREQLRGAGSSVAVDDLGSLAAPARSRMDVLDGLGELLGTGKSRTEPDRGMSVEKREALEDFLRQLLQPPNLAGGRGAGGIDSEKAAAASAAVAGALARSRGTLDAGDLGHDKEGAARRAASLSMAEHAREYGNKYLQDRHFGPAAHCYEVACLLCPAGAGASGHLAAYHCNCALACLELGRYGDAINESNAALVLTPPKHLAVKALYRLAVAHANLKNGFEARRCLKRCLELDPLNEYARFFLSQLGGDEAFSAATGATVTTAVQAPHGGFLTWVDLPKRVQCLGTVAREKAKGKKAKEKAKGPTAVDEVRIDREAGLWHTMARHNRKLYILGGWSDGADRLIGLGAAGLPTATGAKGDAPGSGSGSTAAKGGSTGGTDGAEAPRGSDELHVLDLDTFELRQLSGPNSKPPFPCYCHSATMVGTNMVVFGGLGPPVDQPPLVMLFDTLQAKWRVPVTSGLAPRQRQGHTANAIQGDRQLCIFGGIEPTGEQRVARVYSDVHLLDLQSCTWRKLEVGGRRPPARFGHSATNLPGCQHRLLIVGGRDHLGSSASDQELAGGFTGLHLLDTERRIWAQQSFSGSPPLQAFYHSACMLDDQTLLVLASGASAGAEGTAEAGTVPLHLLDLESWRWSCPRISGLGPSPRVGHAAAALGGRVYLFGGVVRRANGQPSVDKAMYVLEATLLTSKPDKEKVVTERPEALQDSAASTVSSKGTTGSISNVAGQAAPAAGIHAAGGGIKNDRVSTKAAAKAATGPLEKQILEPAGTGSGCSNVAGGPPTTAVPDRAGSIHATASGTPTAGASVGSSINATSAAPSSSSSTTTTNGCGHGGIGVGAALTAGTADKVRTPASSPPKHSISSNPAPTGTMQPQPCAAGPALTEGVKGPQTAGATGSGVTAGSSGGAGLEAGRGRGRRRGGTMAPATVVAPTGAAGAAAASSGSTPATRDERIEMMLKENDFGDDLDDGPELSFEELLAQEKAFFKAQSEKASFPRANEKLGGKEKDGNGKKKHSS